MDGVPIAPGNERHPELLAAMDAMGSPTVILDRDMGSLQDSVQFDHVPPAYAAWCPYLIGLGHRKIALVAQTQNRPMRRRIEGLRGIQGTRLDGE